MYSIYKELGKISAIARSIIICGIFVAVLLMGVAIYQSRGEGLLADYVSMSWATVAAEVFAETVILGLVGEVFIRRNATK